MVELTDSAREELEAYFEGKEKSAIRIFLASGGCAGVRLVMALDEAGESDETCERGGFTFIVSKDLLETTGNLSIDMGPMGFSIDSDIPIESGGGCSGCASSGSCGG